MNNNFATIVTLLTTLSDAEKSTLLQLLITMGKTTVTAGSTPVKRSLDPATDVEISINQVKAPKGHVAFTIGYGAGRAGAKLAVKSAGFKWDESYAEEGTRHGAWVGTSAQAKTLGVNTKSTTLKVSAEFVEQGRAKAQAKADRKARKSA